jgi:hypothetical protein
LHIDVETRPTGLLVEKAPYIEQTNKEPLWRRVSVDSLFEDRTGNPVMAGVFDDEVYQSLTLI